MFAPQLLASPLFNAPAAISDTEGNGSSGLESLVKFISPSSVITHEKGNLRWRECKPSDPSTYRVEVVPGTGTLSLMDHGHPDYKSYYWDRTFVVSSESALPHYTARYDNVLTWVNPETGASQDMDFEVEFQALGRVEGAESCEVRQYYVNGFYTVGITHAQVTYKIYAHGSDTPIDPGLFAYWCRSLNPGECVAFSRKANPHLTLDAAYLTDHGIYNNPIIDDADVIGQVSDERDLKRPSSVLVDEVDGDLLKFTGAKSVTCKDGSEIDVSDGPQGFNGQCGQHRFVDEPGGDAGMPSLELHGYKIPYSEYIQYRAVTFDVAPGADPNEGLTLDYFADDLFYWEMEFNGIVVTRHLPTKTLVDGGTAPLPGDEVTFEIDQSLDDIPANLVTELVFEDALPKGLEYRSAAMVVDGRDVTETAGELEVSGNKVAYRFGREGLGQLKYGSDGSECALRITARISSDVPYEAKLANKADVTMNTDRATTPEAVVSVAPEPTPEPEPEPEPSVDVTPNKGVLLIAKDVDTPNDSGAANVGERVDYVVSVQNDGNATLTNVVIQDSLPEGLIVKDKPRLTDADRRTITSGSCEYWQGQVMPDGSIVQLFHPGQIDDAGQAGEAARMGDTGGSVDGGRSNDEVTALGYVWSGTIIAKVPKLEPGGIVHVELEAAIGKNATPTVTNVALAVADDHPAVSASASVKVPRDSECDDPSADDPDDNGTDPGTTPGTDDSTPSGPDGPGSSGTNQPGAGGGTGADDGSGTGGGSTGDGSTGRGGSTGPGGGSTGAGYPGGSYGTGDYPVYQEPYDPTYDDVPASSGQTASPAKSRRLPQTDAPPAIEIATTGGIGMTGAFLISTLRDRHRYRW